MVKRSKVPALLLVSLWPLAAAAAPKTRLTPEEADPLVREISAKVEQIRGLKFKTPVAIKVINGKEARENFKSKIQPGEAESVRHVQYAYIQLGLIPRGADLVKGYLDLAELVTILLTRWETVRDAEDFERALLSKGKYAYRYGVNFIVIEGDVGDKGEALAIAAMQGGRMFWPTE